MLGMVGHQAMFWYFLKTGKEIKTWNRRVEKYISIVWLFSILQFVLLPAECIWSWIMSNNCNSFNINFNSDNIIYWLHLMVPAPCSSHDFLETCGFISQMKNEWALGMNSTREMNVLMGLFSFFVLSQPESHAIDIFNHHSDQNYR